MKNINILPPIIYNRLAAGEVVENPASIVKELIENSLDAGAKFITVQITNGGIDEIIVTDDGEGVDETNLPKVFMPHATSKIKEIADIEHIVSLGFRGEAMASIAAVAKVEFTSKPKDQDYAACINQDNEIKYVGANQGTTVRVANLFYNTPARKKFLRSTNAEKNSVTQVVQNIIFANPALSLRYLVDGRVVLDYQGQGLDVAMQKIYAVNPTDLLSVDYQENGLAVRGFISNIRTSKINRERQVIIINGRFVNGGLPAAVVNEVMANYLPIKEYAIFVLHFTIATDQVDVNVHPQKKEVRFENKGQIAQFIRHALTQLMDQYFLNQINELTPAKNSLKSESVPPENVTSATPKVTTNFVGRSFDAAQTQSETVIMKTLDAFATEDNTVQSAPNILNHLLVTQSADQAIQTSTLPADTFTILGQIFETYLLVRTKDALLVIDQHAMAERMNYDRFRTQIDQGTVQSQILLTPLIIKLTPNEMSRFAELKNLLTSFGFDSDEFGDTAIRITAVPAMMANAALQDFIAVILNDKEVVNDRLSEIVKHKVATAACKASIRAGDILSNPQIELFLKNYFQTKNIPLCPHGRPIMLVYNKNKLESMFARK